MKIQRHISFIALLVLLVVYIGCYYLIVDRGWPGSKIADPWDAIPCSPRYCDSYSSNNLCNSFFLPIHMIDRIVRGHYWNPIVKDLAEQARREGVIQ